MKTRSTTKNDASASRYTGFDQFFIDGKWISGKGKPCPDFNPWTGETLLEVSGATEQDVDAAYRAAQRAQRDWAARLPSERAEIMLKAATLVGQRLDEIIDWLVREGGGTQFKATMEATSILSLLREASALPYMVEGRILPADVLHKESRVYRRAVGVVGVISPWNVPLHLSARSTIPAIAVGNAVVLKPAEDTPVSGGLLLAKLLEEAGLPAGVLNVVCGAGEEIGDAFVKHAVPRVISFTGSTKVGRSIQKLTADSALLKKLDLELGGNAPCVVLADADLEYASTAAVFGKFFHQGQVCMITNRLIVEAKVYDEFVDLFVAKTKALKVGDPNDPETFIGPVINQKQFKSLTELIAKARGAQGRELLGGDPKGQVIPPHVFATQPDNPLNREEIFGPIAPISRAEDEDEALRMANDTEYGLSSAVFTRDLERGARFARQIEAGMTHVNDQSVQDLIFNPFGGEKNSGVGRYNGRWAVEAFTTEHWITVQHEPFPFVFDARKLRPAQAHAAED